MQDITTNDTHIEIAGRALKLFADAHIGLGDAQMCMTLMLLYMSLKFEWNVDEVLRLMGLNIEGVAGNAPAMRHIIQGIHREVEHSRIFVPGANRTPQGMH